MALMILGLENTDSCIDPDKIYSVLDTESLHLSKISGSSVISLKKMIQDKFLNVYNIHMGGVTRYGISRQCVRFEDFIKLGIYVDSSMGRMTHLSKTGVLTKLVFGEPFVLKSVQIRVGTVTVTISASQTSKANVYCIKAMGYPVLFLKTKNGKAVERVCLELIGVWLSDDNSVLTCFLRFGDTRGVIDGGYLENISFNISTTTGEFLSAEVKGFESSHNLDIKEFEVIPVSDDSINKYLGILR